MKRSLPSIEDSLRILRTNRTRRAPKAPPPVQKQVQPILKSLEARFKGLDDPAHKLQRRWQEIVGDKLARLCEPVRVIKGRPGSAAGSPPGSPHGGALEIRVQGAYAPLIQHQSGALIDRINLFLGGKSVERLRIIQGPLATKPRTPPPPKPQPLTAAEDLALQQELGDVSDEKVRTALLKLGRSVLRKQKLTRS
ncbi:DUF721 domain-containing protein [Asticcacaulis sp. AC402]|uniref:DUF721 domain-containing protein n=1 Tax=Asticcacaulis sp. AC402 TaxID=1282361 RepID=UPI0003C3D013|nr:DciA family protein [Asticcacaulis sp. AC402]ESQ76801.1 hypothetical protein ABAC402_03835 [Asticcacaulis sp. AC402]